MKSIFNIRVIVILIILLSCKKSEIVAPSAPPDNQQVAKAGPDITIYLPDDEFVTLDGSKSAAAWKYGTSWKKLTGDTVLMVYAYEYMQYVGFIIPGNYSFELTVRDATGAMARDTMNVTVGVTTGCVFNQPIVEAVFNEVVPENSDLDAYLYGQSFVWSNGKVFLSGGTGSDDFGNIMYSDLMWMLDLGTKRWKKFNLSMKKGMSSAVANDDLVLVAGGTGSGGVTDGVDIFDPLTEKLVVDKISVARMDLTGVSIGSEFIFAGGIEKNDKYSDIVDIYDTRTKKWSTAKLSEPRRRMSAVVSGTKIYFSGGEVKHGVPSSRIDIYDQNTGQWSVSKMEIPRFGVQAAITGNSILYVAGYNDQTDDGNRVNKAELLNIGTQSSSIQCIAGHMDFNPIRGVNEKIAVVGNSTCFYANDNMLLKYEVGSNSWSRAFLPRYIYALFSHRNELFALTTGNQGITVHKITM